MTMATSGLGSFVTFGIIIGIGLLAAFAAGCLIAMALGFYYIGLVVRDKWRAKFWTPQQHAQDVIREVTANLKEQLEKEKNEHRSDGTTHRKARR